MIMILIWTCSVWARQWSIKSLVKKKEKEKKESRKPCVCPYWLCSLSSPQRSWVEVCMLTRTSSCVMQTQSIGRTLSKTHGSIQWWCPPTAVSCVSITQQAQVWKTRRFVFDFYSQGSFTDSIAVAQHLHIYTHRSCTVKSQSNLRSTPFRFSIALL